MLIIEVPFWHKKWVSIENNESIRLRFHKCSQNNFKTIIGTIKKIITSTIKLNYSQQFESSNCLNYNTKFKVYTMFTKIGKNTNSKTSSFVIIT